MTSPDGRQPPYRSFALQVVVVAAALLAAGWWLTAAAGPGTRAAMTVGMMVATVASLAGGAAGRGLAPTGTVAMMFGAMATRLVVAMVLAVTAVFSGRWRVTPLLLSLVVAHLVLLVPDSFDAIRLRRDVRKRTDEEP